MFFLAEGALASRLDGWLGLNQHKQKANTHHDLKCNEAKHLILDANNAETLVIGVGRLASWLMGCVGLGWTGLVRFFLPPLLFFVFSHCKT